jgi:hypothetical protein
MGPLCTRLMTPGHPLKTQYNPLQTLLGPSDFGLGDLWLSESYHPRPEHARGEQPARRRERGVQALLLSGPAARGRSVS